MNSVDTRKESKIDELLFLAGLINIDLRRKRFDMQYGASAPILPTHVVDFKNMTIFLTDYAKQKRFDVVATPRVSNSLIQYHDKDNPDSGGRIYLGHQIKNTDGSIHDRKNLTIIWDLVHEVGHLLIFDLSKIRNKEHEQHAWDAGEQLVSDKYPCIENNRQSFEEWKKDCLSTY
ncbi:MAG: hypothetical protein GX659_05365 [Myxococcales bacterium]|jgi:hypothetical protein|nr:hypothetical protein [Myxococcales bacterium]